MKLQANRIEAGEAVSAVASAILSELTETDLEALADRLRPYLGPRTADPDADRWLNAKEAARYLGGTTGRVYDLVQLRKLEPRRDGRRLLFRRVDLDAYLEVA